MSDFDIKMGRKNKLSVEFEDPKQNLTLKNQPADKKEIKTLNDVIMDVDALKDGSLLRYEADTQTFRLSTGFIQLDDNFEYKIEGTIVPNEEGTFDLGTPETPFRSLYLAGQTLYMGNLSISDAGNGSLDLYDTQTNTFIGSLSTITAQQADIFNLIVDGVANLTYVNVANGISVNNDIYANNVYVNSNLQVNGDIILRGSSLQLGDGGDVISLGATVNSSIIATDSDTYDLGSGLSLWRTVYANTVTELSAPVNEKDAVNKLYVDTEVTTLNTALSTAVTNLTTYVDNVAASIVTTANATVLGTDQDITDGAVVTMTSNTTVYDALDKLNEAMLNVHNGTYVRDVAFTATPDEGGEGTEVTLTMVITGTPNQYTIDWGDGTVDTTTDSTPSHTYTDNTNSPYTVTVTARNTDGYGEASSASLTRTDYIVIYTADPILSFDIYTAQTGGSVTTEANTGETIWFDNTTQNADMAEGQMEVSWGDGSANDEFFSADPGGYIGPRLSHQYTTSSGTGSYTIEYQMVAHGSANPAIFPLSTTSTIKVFDLAIAAPNGLDSKTIQWAVASQGTSPRLAYGFTDNTGDGTLAAGDSVTRYTSGTVLSYPLSSYFYTSGGVTQNVNGTQTGTPTVDASNVDYYNLDANGNAVSPSNRIYAEGLYVGGTKARVAYDITSGSTGANKIGLSTNNGDSNELEYVYDDMTSAPTVDVSSATISEAVVPGYRYISGIPYYQVGDTLTVSGLVVNNLTGQTYKLDSSPFTISGTPAETTTYTYADALSGTDHVGGIPRADLSSVNIEDLTVAISSADSNGTISFTAENVNGSDSETILSPVIHAFTGTDVIDELNIPVENGSNGKRIKGFIGGSPAFDSSTDYYVDYIFSGYVDLTSTDEAVVRYGELVHFAEDLTTGHLPVGDNLNTSNRRIRRQYFRFAFKKSGASSIRLRMTGRCSGVYIAAPGTAIDDTSTLSGWLDAGVQYAGAGIPGGDTANGGNGSDGCAFTGADIIVDGTDYNDATFDLTFGTESTTNAYNNQVLVSIILNSDDSITDLSIEEVS